MQVKFDLFSGKEDSPERAYRWVRGCYEIMLTLENFINFKVKK